MSVGDILREREAVSFEIFPPKTDAGMEKLCGAGGVLDRLYGLRPDYISCTYGAGGTNVGIMPVLDMAAIINMSLSRNGCAMDRELCHLIARHWIFPNPFDRQPCDAMAEQKGEDFRQAGIDYTIRQIGAYRACGVAGIHLYTLNKYDDVARIARESGIADR